MINETKENKNFQDLKNYKSDNYYHILSVAKQLLEGTFFVWYRESAKSIISTSRLYI